MKLWKPAVCLFLSGLLLSACAAPAGSASSGAEGSPAGSSGAGSETAPMESGLDLEKLGVTEENYPRVDGSTSTLGIVQAAYEAVFGPESMDEEGYPWEASKTVPSYEKLIAGDLDLILAPSPSADVLSQAKEAGVELELAQVAAEALIFITPAENTAANITGDQVRDIYLHNGIASWTELGGPDRALVPICRNADSGSQSQLDNLILKGEPMDPSIQENYVELTMEGMLEQTAFYHTGGMFGQPSDSYALGYTLFTYLQNMDEITGIASSLKILDYEGVPATAQTISGGSYPLTDGYYAVTRADLPEDHPARVLTRWLRSEEGQVAILSRGFLPVYLDQLPPQDTEENARQVVLDYYSSCDIQEVTLVGREGDRITFQVQAEAGGQSSLCTITLDYYPRGWQVVSADLPPGV